MTDDNKQFVVYIATNIVNGHRYVGFTSVGLEKRRRKHIQDSKRDKRCPKFHNALCKYGEEAFNWKIVATFDTANKAIAEEIRLIAELNPEYNVTTGGEGTPGVAAHNRKPVTCLEDGKMFVSMSHAAKFYKMNTSDVLSVCTGKNRSFNNLHFIFGDKMYSEIERKELIKRIEQTAARRRKKVFVNKNNNGPINGKDIFGRKATGPMKRARKVLCIDDGKIHVSASEAARYYNISKSAIIELCLGKNCRKTVSGLRFKYETV